MNLLPFEEHTATFEFKGSCSLFSIFQPIVDIGWIVYMPISKNPNGKGMKSMVTGCYKK